jgi:hypothetical protein
MSAISSTKSTFAFNYSDKTKQLKSYIPPYRAELGWKALFQEIVDSGTWPARLEVLLVAH